MSWWKRIVLVIGAGVLLLAAAVTALSIWLDTDQARQALIAEVERRYQRTVKVDGALSITVLPDIAVNLDLVSISEPDSPQLFAALKSLRISISVPALLRGKVVVHGIRASGLRANLMRDEQGRWNFDNLMGVGEEPDAHDPANLAFAIKSIVVDSGELVISDDRLSTSIRVEKLGARTGPIRLGEPFDLDLAGRIMGSAPRIDLNVQGRGQAIFDPDLLRYELRGAEFKLSGVAPPVRIGSLTARGRLGFDGREQRYYATNLALLFQGDVGGAWPLTQIDARLDVQDFNFNRLAQSLYLSTFSSSGQGRAGQQQVNWMTTAPSLGFGPHFARGDALNARLRIGGETAHDFRLRLEGWEGKLDALKVARLSAGWEHQEGRQIIKAMLETPVRLEQSRVLFDNIKGEFLIDDASMKAKHYEIPLRGRFDLDWKLLHMRSELVAELNDKSQRLIVEAVGKNKPFIRFSASSEGLDLSGFSQVAGTSKSYPWSAKPWDEWLMKALARVDAYGQVRVDALTTAAMAANNIRATAYVDQGRAVFTAIEAETFDGRVRAEGYLDSQTHQLELGLVYAGQELGQLLRYSSGLNWLDGPGSLDGLIRSTLGARIPWASTLNGQLSLNMSEGRWYGVDLVQAVETGLREGVPAGDVPLAYDPAQETRFDQLRASLDFHDGEGIVSHLLVASPAFVLREDRPSTFNLYNKEVSLMTRLTMPGHANGKARVTLPFRLLGSLNRPTLLLRWSQLNQDVLRLPRNPLEPVS